MIASNKITPVMPTYGRTDLAFERGEGAYLETVDGARYLDFAGGIAVNVAGHAHPHLVAALTEQAAKLWHTSNLYRIPGQERLAQRLVDNTFADTMFFTNSGAEAMECAIKLARKYHYVTGSPKRTRIITFEGAFHGRTLATISAGRQAKHIEGFGPLVEGFDQVPFCDLDAVKAAVTDETAAILLEPIQGEGGIVEASTDFLRAMRNLADEHGLLLLFDEVQTGLGRTGKLFAYEWSDITPDVMAIAKGIGGGFPMGACLATEAAAQGMTAGSHGSTYGGNPLAMSVGNAVLDIVLEDGFFEHVNDIANRLRQGLAMIVHDHPQIFEDIRGRGLMIGLKCKVPNTDVLAACIDEGLLAALAGDNVLRLLPPLIIGADEVSDALSRLDRACTKIAGRVEEHGHA